MILIHQWSRTLCQWIWRLVPKSVAAAMPHLTVAAGVCAGGAIWLMPPLPSYPGVVPLPPAPYYVPPADIGQMPPAWGFPQPVWQPGGSDIPPFQIPPASGFLGGGSPYPIPLGESAVTLPTGGITELVPTYPITVVTLSPMPPAVGEPGAIMLFLGGVSCLAFAWLYRQPQWQPTVEREGLDHDLHTG